MKKIYNLMFILVIVSILSITLVSANKIITTGKESREYAKWAIQMYKKTTPYNETKWAIYSDGTKESKGDVKIIIKDIPYYGYGFPTSKTKAGLMTINPESFKVVNQEFLLFHESGHIFGLPHSSDGSIMDMNGGDAQYREYQIKTIRSNLR